MITFGLYHHCVVGQKEFSRKVEMSKVESFYCNKLSSKSFSFYRSRFFICFCFSCSWGAALITSSIYDYCVIRQKEFSRKVEMRKVESFYWNKLSSKSLSFELEQFFYLCFVLAVHGFALISSNIYDYCVIRQKEFSRKVEMSKVESLYWNKLSSKSFSFELEQLFDLCFVLTVHWGCTDNI